MAILLREYASVFLSITVLYSYVVSTRFVDRDMLMRFRGGGVGHKSTCNATNHFLGDRFSGDLVHVSDGDIDGEPANADNEMLQDKLPENDNDLEEVIVDEELDYGYENPFEEQDVDFKEEEIGEEMIDEWEDLDILGPEDGEEPNNDVENLGFADL